MANQPANSRPTLPWKTRIQVALLSAVTDASIRRDGTVNRRLINFFDAHAKPDPNPIRGVRTADFSLNNSLWVRVFSPAAGDRSAALPVVVFFHGGGFVFLSAASKAYDAVCRRFARNLPAVVVSVNYRLAPEHRFPTAYEDGTDVLRWLDRDPTCSGFAPDADPARVFLAGDSAGGNIAHHVAVRFSQISSETRSVRLIGLVSIQPFFGGKERTDSEVRLEGAPIVSSWRTDLMWKAFLPPGSDRDHPAANVWGPKSEVEMAGVEYPATLVVVGGMDPLQERQRRYAGWLEEMGKEVRSVEYENAIHAFYVFPELPETPLLLAELKAFVLKQQEANGY